MTSVKLINHSSSTADWNYLFSPYLYAFLNGYLNRPVCYSCPYARSGRVGDITLADFCSSYIRQPDFYFALRLF